MCNCNCKCNCFKTRDVPSAMAGPMYRPKPKEESLEVPEEIDAPDVVVIKYDQETPRWYIAVKTIIIFGTIVTLLYLAATR